MDRVAIRSIRGFPGYGVTRDGRIWSENGRVRWLNPRRTTKGYLLVNLYQDGRVTKHVHRLVAEAFIPNPEGKPQVNHVNGNKTDNRVGNLEWVTPSENIQHAFDTGLRVGTTGEAHWSSKLTLTQVREIRERYAAGGVLQRELGAEYGVSQQVVGDIVRGNSWREA